MKAKGAYEMYSLKRVFFIVLLFFFVGVGFDRALIAPVASGVLGCGAVITQQGAHLRQPCLLSEPRNRGPVSKASPVM